MEDQKYFKAKINGVNNFEGVKVVWVTPTWGTKGGFENKESTISLICNCNGSDCSESLHVPNGKPSVVGARIWAHSAH